MTHVYQLGSESFICTPHMNQSTIKVLFELDFDAHKVAQIFLINTLGLQEHAAMMEDILQDEIRDTLGLVTGFCITQGSRRDVLLTEDFESHQEAQASALALQREYTRQGRYAELVELRDDPIPRPHSWDAPENPQLSAGHQEMLKALQEEEATDRDLMSRLSHEITQREDWLDAHDEQWKSEAYEQQAFELEDYKALRVWLAVNYDGYRGQTLPF